MFFNFINKAISTTHVHQTRILLTTSTIIITTTIVKTPIARQARSCQTSSNGGREGTSHKTAMVTLLNREYAAICFAKWTLTWLESRPRKNMHAASASQP